MKKQNPYLFRFNNYHHGQDSVLKRNKRCSKNSLQKLNCFVAFIDFYIFANINFVSQIACEMLSYLALQNCCYVIARDFFVL